MNETSEAYLFSLIKNPVSKDKGFLQLMDTYKKPLYWHIRRLVVSHEDAPGCTALQPTNAPNISGKIKTG